MNDKELDKGIAKKMINPYYFIDEILKIGFKINLESHNFIHAKSLLNVEPNFPDIGIEFRYINKIMKELSVNYARLINQCNLNIIYYSQQAFIRLMKKIKEVTKLNYSFI